MIFDIDYVDGKQVAFVMKESKGYDSLINLKDELIMYRLSNEEGNLEDIPKNTFIDMFGKNIPTSVSEKLIKVMESARWLRVGMRNTINITKLGTEKLLNLENEVEEIIIDMEPKYVYEAPT